jgi:RimJ/RimL family protein N-acetyltransferase
VLRAQDPVTVPVASSRTVARPVARGVPPVWSADVVPEVRTERLVLRGWRPEDRSPYAELNADPVVGEYLGGPLARGASDAMVERYEEHWAQEGFGIWAVEVPGVAPLVGSVGLRRVPGALPCAPAVEVAWRLAHDAWGQGYATEGARAAVVFAFDTVGLDELVAFTTVGNTRSRRVMERLGMTHDPRGDFAHPHLAAGDPNQPHVLYRLRADPPGT